MCEMVERTFADPAGLAVVVDETTVAVHQVGDVLRLTEAATRDRQRFAGADDAQLNDAFQRLLEGAVRLDRLHLLEL